MTTGRILPMLEIGPPPVPEARSATSIADARHVDREPSAGGPSQLGAGLDIALVDSSSW